MKNFLLNLLIGVTISFVFAFVLSFGVIIFVQIFFGGDAEIIFKGFDAFLGAFFAFLFIRIGDILKSVYDRKKKSYNTLVEIEHVINDSLGASSDNISITRNIISTIEENETSSPIKINSSVFAQYTDFGEKLIPLVNIDLINLLYSLNLDLKRIGHDLSSNQKIYSDLNSVFIDKKIDKQNYLNNLKDLKTRLNTILKFEIATDGKILDVMAALRIVCVSEMPLLTRIMSKLSFKNGLDKFSKDIAKERNNIEAEREEIRRKSEDEIGKILK